MARQHRGDALVELADALVQPPDVGGGGAQPGQVDPGGPGELELVGDTPGERAQLRPDLAGGWQHRPHDQGGPDQHRLGLIQQPPPLGDQAAPLVAQGDQLLPVRVSSVLLAGGWQLGMGQGLAGDRLGVLGVGLGPAPPTAPLGGAAGLHLAHVIAGGGQEGGDLVAQPRRALHADAVQLEVHRAQPGQRLRQPLLAGGEAGHAVPAAALVKDRDGEGALVRVDAGHPHGRGGAGAAGWSTASMTMSSASPLLAGSGTVQHAGPGAGRSGVSGQAPFKPGSRSRARVARPDNSSQGQPLGANRVESQGLPRAGTYLDGTSLPAAMTTPRPGCWSSSAPSARPGSPRSTTAPRHHRPPWRPP
jgi:hypothetical protein